MWERNFHVKSDFFTFVSKESQNTYVFYEILSQIVIYFYF